MVKSFGKKVLYFWPVIVLALTTILLFLTNYKTGTYLTGWDNLHPEFSPLMNIKRSIFAVWQEYQGLGLLGGMGHAADLPRQIIILFMSFIMPQNLTRYVMTFAALFIGSTGAYFLISFIFKKLNIEHYKSYAFLGGLFYLLNLSTIQTFYVPYEAFSAHFAALPWLILTAISYFNNPNKKSLLIFSLVLFLSIPGFYIPTLFIVYLITLAILLIPLIKSSFKGSLVKIIKLLGLVFIINAFWLLPFLFFTFTKSSVNVDAKINQMATETIFLQNKEFGNITDVILLRGFWFNNVDPNLSGNFSYMLSPWKQYLANPLITALGFSFFGIILLGIFDAMRKPTRLKVSFLILFLFSFTMLATSTLPFSLFDILFRKLPLFGQAFRFPFTKFSILLSLNYAIFFALGLNFISKIISKKIIRNGLYIAIGIFLILFTLPAFKGNLFYEKETISIPKEYSQVFDFFSHQDKNTRIANLPQYTFWGWTFYKWGYGGSGFPWYGIEQPILDRAFDVWSAEDENYYWELSNAIYSKDPKNLENVLNKYQITWLMVDKNVISPQNPKVLFYSEIQDLLNKIPSIAKSQTFGNIDIYKVSLKDKPNSFIFETNPLSSVNGYTWTNNDKAYSDFENYISSQSSSYLYPFRTLFSNKQEQDREFNISNKDTYFEFKSPISSDYSNGFVTFKPDSILEKTSYADVVIQEGENNKILSVILKQPQIYLNDKKIWGGESKVDIFNISQNAAFPISININGVRLSPITKDAKPGVIQTVTLSNTQDNILVLTDANQNSTSAPIVNPIVENLNSNAEVKISLGNIDKNSQIFVRIPKANSSSSIFNPGIDKANVSNCDNFRKGNFSSQTTVENNKAVISLSSQNSTACISFYNTEIPHNQGYLITLDAKNIQGRPLHFWVLNEDSKFSPIDTYLGTEKNLTQENFIIPPMEEFGNAYSFHFENQSIGSDQTQNMLSKANLYPIPYNFLTNLLISKPNIPAPAVQSESNLQIKHPNESLYVINANTLNDKTLILSQAFDNGWKAYQVKDVNFITETFPFLFGKEIKTHVKVNNWENGWTIDNTSSNNQIVIVYLPQYLEYFGFIILIFIPLGFAMKRPLW